MLTLATCGVPVSHDGNSVAISIHGARPSVPRLMNEGTNTGVASRNGHT